MLINLVLFENLASYLLNLSYKILLMKTVLLLLGLITVISGHTQLEQGSKIVGIQTTLTKGNTYATYLAMSSKPYAARFGMDAAPMIGWAIARNWVIGGQATFGTFVKTDKTTSPWVRQIYYDLGLAPFTRVYIDVIKSGRVKIFGTGSVEFVYQVRKVASQSGNTEFAITTNDTFMGAAAGGGLAYFGKRISLDAQYGNLGFRIGLYRTFGAVK